MAASPTTSGSTSTGSIPSLRERRRRCRSSRTCTASSCPAASASAAREGKIAAVRFARERKVPYFGICFGMQMAVIEAARNLAGIRGAGSTEFGPCAEPVVGLMTEWMRGNASSGARPAAISAAPCGSAPTTACSSRAAGCAAIYRARSDQRAAPPPLRGEHQLQGTAGAPGLRFSGMSPDGMLPEIVEIARPSLVHRRAVPSRAEVEALRAASAVHLVHRRRGRAVAAGVTRHASPHEKQWPAAGRSEEKGQ